MAFKLIFRPDEAYYKEAYYATTSKWKKLEPIFATTLTAIGILLYLLDKNNVLGVFPFFISGAGIYEFFKFYYEKRKWLKARNDSKIKGQQIELEFSDEKIKHSGPFSSGEISWAGIKIIKKTKKGIVIKPENGMSIYLPDHLFKGREEIDFILTKM